MIVEGMFLEALQYSYTLCRPQSHGEGCGPEDPDEHAVWNLLYRRIIQGKDTSMGHIPYKYSLVGAYRRCLYYQ